MASSYRGVDAFETFGTTSPASGSAPSEATDGQPVGDNALDAILVVAEAPASETLSGAGTLTCYIYDSHVAAWIRYAAGDISLVGIPATQRRVAFPVGEVPFKRGRIKWVPTSVTFSGGSSGVKIYQLGYSRILRGVAL
jgi:hypothetical protein